MPGIGVLLVVVAGIAVTAGGAAARTVAASQAAPASCAMPTLRVAGFARHHAPVSLGVARTSVGLRLQRPVRRLEASLFDYSGCIDTVVCTIGQPCEPPVQPPPKTTPVQVARMMRIKARVAVADLATPNVIYVGRAGMPCLRRAKYPASLARCLRAASR